VAAFDLTIPAPAAKIAGKSAWPPRTERPGGPPADARRAAFRGRIPNMIEKAVNQLAEKILNLDEASLTALWEKYKDRMERFEVSREWERSVIVFFIINAVRAKNHIFNEQIAARQQPTADTTGRRRGKPELIRVK
jgi:hypothetical protein